jgi:CRISPR/Cas system CSM-associated protein Csm3 (group 7 of RAMP superfamily)
MGISYRNDEDKFKKYLENFIRALQGEESNTPHGAKELEEILIGLGYTIEEIKEVRERGSSAERELLETMAEEYLALHCPISKLYGNKMAGKIRFFDSLIMATPSIRPGIGIDRKSGKVKENLLYFINVIPRGHIVLKIVMDNILQGEDDSRLFASTLKLIKTLGVSIGARKSAGLGHLELTDGEFYVLDVESDGRTMEFRIGNPLRKAERVSLDKFVEWLCP